MAMGRRVLLVCLLGLGGLGGSLVAVPEARADVYACRDRQGVIRFSNRKLAGYRCTLYAKSPKVPVASLGGTGDDGSASAGSSAGDGGATPTGNGGGDVRVGAPSTHGPSAHYAPVPVAGVRFSGDEPDDRSGREKLYGPYFEEAASLYSLPAPFLRAVARTESNFRYRAKSGPGAMGLMQLMPVVAREMGVADPWDPRSNILGGARLLRILADRWKGDMVKVLSAYHAGSGAVASADGIPYEATESYVRSVLDFYYQYKSELAGAADPGAPGDPAPGDPATP